MMLSFATKALVLGLIAGIVPAANAQTCSIILPEMAEVMEMAFPTWNVDANNTRIEGGGKWNPYYLTKRWNGLDPKLGGYPTPIDTRYPFEFAAPFKGQPGAGSPHHCPKGTTKDTPVQSCPKFITDNDDGEYGIGHVPPPTALAVVRNAVKECADESEFASWFDFESTSAPCDIKPSVLSTMIRNKYPRDPETGAVSYPPPVFEGTFEYYELEFPSPQGPPHWCTDEYLASGQWADYCPYVYEGPNAGKYRHPHLALSAVMQYIAHSINPAVCGVEWDERGYPKVPDTSIAWATMDSEGMDAQPILPYNWPENDNYKQKDVPGLVSIDSVGDVKPPVDPKPTPVDPKPVPEPPKMGEPVDDMTETAAPTENEASGSSSVSVVSAIASVVMGCVFF